MTYLRFEGAKRRKRRNIFDCPEDVALNPRSRIAEQKI
jgi:hypothetical protein